MMFIISLIFFIGGLFLFGVAYMVTSFQGLVFTAGILAVCVAMAIPMFRRSVAHEASQLIALDDAPQILGSAGHRRVRAHPER